MDKLHAHRLDITSVNEFSSEFKRATESRSSFTCYGAPIKRVFIFTLLASLLYYTLPWSALSFRLSLKPLNSHSCPSLFGDASEALQWYPCGGSRFQCANLSVPLDYLNKKDNRTASIAITRYLASNPEHAKTGTIIFNPGGPGGSGTATTYRFGPALDEVLQGQYDILGFDPRGINLTIPKVDCFKSRSTRAALAQVIGSTAPSFSTVSEDVNKVVINARDIGIWDSFSQIVAEQCEEEAGSHVLPFVNTPTVARDIASIADALHAENRHRVSYWGFSYGTNLGTIFTGMFPNKLHKVILDGIRSPFDAREVFEWGYTSLASQDDVMNGYFEICDKVGKARCPLSGNSKQDVMTLLAQLYERPLPVSGDGHIGMVTYYNYKNFFYGTLYRPTSWGRFANITRDLLHGDGRSFLAATGTDFSVAESGIAVLCTDAGPATNYSLASWTEYIKNMTERSFIAGDDRALDTLACRHWNAVPNERWTGSFDGVQLDTPVLLIGNTYDPATPLDSAKRLLATMGPRNARLLEQKSYGHCSISSVSTCTWTTILDYLLYGDLPSVGRTCEVDAANYTAYFPERDAEVREESFRKLQAAFASVL